MQALKRYQGFAFCGRHCSEFGVWYTPGGDRLKKDVPPFDISTVETPGRNGGYCFGNHLQPRVFTLPCFFDAIEPATWPRIQAWLSRDQFGV